MADRKAIKSFWDKYSGEATVESMMLNQEAGDLNEHDQIDIMSSLPDLTGKDVVELGAGIGRFTGALAKRAGHVWASDFIKSFIDQNREIHKDFDNITFVVNHAADLEFDNASKDHVFTNWLLMYLTDKEVVEFLVQVLRWLKPGGTMHIRESCSEPSSKHKKKGDENPTYYRHISEYLELLRLLQVDGYRLQPLWSTSVPTYITMGNNWRQGHLLVEKVAVEPSPASLAKSFGIWRSKQGHWDSSMAKLSGSDESLVKFAANTIKGSVGADLSGVLLISTGNPVQLLSPFDLAKELDCGILSVETNEWRYSAMLGLANEVGDQRVRFHYAPPGAALTLAHGFADTAFALSFLSRFQQRPSILKDLKGALKPHSTVHFVESGLTENNGLATYTSALEKSGFYNVHKREIDQEVPTLPGFLRTRAQQVADLGLGGTAVKFSPWHVITAKVDDV